mmetsp:Transcript_3437/g.3937  ORF Transcript_3437/g.3937 Transcript_3437/m.3937 type:complete len:229 (+) Transcript_3437:473-1159(+)
MVWTRFSRAPRPQRYLVVVAHDQIPSCSNRAMHQAEHIAPGADCHRKVSCQFANGSNKQLLVCTTPCRHGSSLMDGNVQHIWALDWQRLQTSSFVIAVVFPIQYQKCSKFNVCCGTETPEKRMYCKLASIACGRCAHLFVEIHGLVELVVRGDDNYSHDGRIGWLPWDILLGRISSLPQAQRRVLQRGRRGSQIWCIFVAKVDDMVGMVASHHKAAPSVNLTHLLALC